MSDEAVRKEFEVWAKGPNLPLRFGGVIYSEYVTELAWMAWQASRSAAIQECVNLIRVVDPQFVLTDALSALDEMMSKISPCGLPLVQGETEEMCRELDKVAARLEARRAAQPAAGTTPHIHECDHETEGEHVCRCVICGKHIGMPPSEATTPQAERPMPLTYEQEVHAILCASAANTEDLLRYFEAQAAQESKDAKKLTKKCIEWKRDDLRRIRALIPQALERREARAVAPVETPNDSFAQSFDAMDWAKAFVAHVKANPSIATDEGTMLGWFANAIMRGYDEHARKAEKSAAETRLTAEQFHKQWDASQIAAPSKYYWYNMAEAFRDKSEAENENWMSRFYVADGEIKELREEIERLKQLAGMPTANLWETLKKEQAYSLKVTRELTELRAKLAEQEKGKQ